MDSLDLELSLLKIKHMVAVMEWNSHSHLALLAHNDEHRNECLEDANKSLNEMEQIEAEMVEKIRSYYGGNSGQSSD